MEMQDGKKEQMRHVTTKRTPVSNGELTSARGTSRNAGGADFKVCVFASVLHVRISCEHV